MEDNAGHVQGRLKRALLAVVVLVGLAVLAATSFVGNAYWRGRTEIVERRDVAQPMPPSSRTSVGDTASPAVVQVVLDFTVGDFQVVRGEAGQPIRLVAEFDKRSYELTETLEPSSDQTWTYRATFQETGWFKDGGLRALLGGSFPKITVWLPPDVPVALEGRFGKGAANLELGGLWLTDIDIASAQGALAIGFDRPLVAPADLLAIRSRQGGMIVRSVGNASPRRLEVDLGMGGMDLDLSGRWTGDAAVHVSSSMGGGAIRLPDDVQIEGLSVDRGRLVESRRLEEVQTPVLTMSVSSHFGRLRIVE